MRITIRLIRNSLLSSNLPDNRTFQLIADSNEPKSRVSRLDAFLLAPLLVLVVVCPLFCQFCAHFAPRFSKYPTFKTSKIKSTFCKNLSVKSLKSCPPSLLLPANDCVINMPPWSIKTETSIVPPPKNNKRSFKVFKYNYLVSKMPNPLILPKQTYPNLRQSQS